MEEIWKLVPGGSEDWFFEASSTGRIRSTRRRYHKICVPPTAKYKRVSYKDTNASAHSLVAAAFLGERPAGSVVNHIDGDKLNNAPENLEYVTPLENSQHALRMGFYKTGAGHHWNTRPELRKHVRGQDSGMAKLNELQVRVIRRAIEHGTKWKQVASLFGICEGTVGFIVARKTWRHI